MSIQRIAGLVFSGWTVRLMGGALAIYVGCKAAAFVVAAFGAVNGLPL